MDPNSNPPHADVVRRAALPEILFLKDLALVLQIAEAEAARAVLAGTCGPYLRISGRLAVRRESLLGALAAQERHVPPPLPDHGDDTEAD